LITDVVLPQMGLEVAEGVVLALPVAVGQTVAEGDVIAEVETDKAIAEVPASRSGVVVAIEVALEDTIPIGTVIVRIADSADETAESGTGAPSGSASSSTPATEPTDAEAAADAIAVGGPVTPTAAGAATVAAPAPTSSTNGSSATAGAVEGANGARRLRAAPIARRAAEAHDVDLQLVTGTGPSGRITLGDIERVVAERDESPAEPQAPAAVTPDKSGGGRLEKLSATRQSIARRLSESQLVPQYTLTREIDAGWLLAEKARLTAAGPIKVGVLDLLLVGLAETVSRHRQLAASFVPARDGKPPAYRHPEAIDLGVAVATDRGLLVPVIRGAEARSVSELVLERSRLVELTRAGRLGPADMGSAAATLSSLGTFGVDQFSAMLNPGESAILAAGRAVERLVPRERGIAVAPMISLTFTFDHRVVDGAVGGAALSELADLLEGGIEWRL
jgi:pyruvate dehydrogenase E2 component (dihydrolipoamide acetyltransferase)